MLNSWHEEVWFLLLFLKKFLISLLVSVKSSPLFEPIVVGLEPVVAQLKKQGLKPAHNLNWLILKKRWLAWWIVCPWQFVCSCCKIVKNRNFPQLTLSWPKSWHRWGSSLGFTVSWVIWLCSCYISWKSLPSVFFLPSASSLHTHCCQENGVTLWLLWWQEPKSALRFFLLTVRPVVTLSSGSAVPGLGDAGQAPCGEPRMALGTAQPGWQCLRENISGKEQNATGQCEEHSVRVCDKQLWLHGQGSRSRRRAAGAGADIPWKAVGQALLEQFFPAVHRGECLSRYPPCSLWGSALEKGNVPWGRGTSKPHVGATLSWSFTACVRDTCWSKGKSRGRSGKEELQWSDPSPHSPPSPCLLGREEKVQELRV